MSTTRRSLLASLGLALPALPLLAVEAQAAAKKPRAKKSAAAHKKPKARKATAAQS